MSARVPQDCLFPIIKDLAEGEWCTAGFDAMSVDLEGQGWINPFAHCRRSPSPAVIEGLADFRGLIIQKVGDRVRVDLTRPGDHRYERAPLPQQFFPETDWIPVAEFIEPT
jgi:hypothetical protein